MTSIDSLKTMCRPHWDEQARRDPVARLWRRDHTLWKPEPDEIVNRLGWLDTPFSMRAETGKLNEFAQEVRRAGMRDVVLLGMGGSSLSAEVLRMAFGRIEDFPRLHVLDSTIPATVQRITEQIDPAATLFLVSSKSGGTIEVMSLYRHFRGLVEQVKGAEAGANFVAITDGGSGLEKLAASEGFRRTFVNPSDIGGRFSVLSYFGLVPAALMGIDTSEFLARGRETARACGVETPMEDNPGAWLGLLMGCLALNGRNKLTIVTSPKLVGFGLWAEQLVAESTGKNGVGIVPVAGEPFAVPESYGADRFFVYLRLKDDDNASCDAHIAALDSAGFPVLTTELTDLYALASAFFRWEFATAIAGACLGIHPFDQPNVEESKKNSRRILQEYEKTRRMPALADDGDAAALLREAQKGDYVALMAFADETPELNAAFAELREAVLSHRRVTTTLGYGPRFLHSTGQIHKGGPAGALCIQFTVEPTKDTPIPGVPYGFAALAAGQAIGDYEALCANQRRTARIHVPAGKSLVEKVRELRGAVAL